MNRRIAALLVATGVLVACSSEDQRDTTAGTEPTQTTTTPVVATSMVSSSTAVTAPPATETTTTETATTEPTTTTNPSTTIASASTTLPETGPVIVESTQYPYALTVQAEEVFRPLRPGSSWHMLATSAWNGTERVIRDKPFNDVFTFTDGSMYVVGVEWLDDLDSLAQMFVDHGKQHNGCSEAKNPQEVSVGGAPALVFTVDSCSGVENLTFVRLATLQDQFGVIAFTESAPGREPADIDRLLGYLSGLEWRAAG